MQPPPPPPPLYFYFLKTVTDITIPCLRSCVKVEVAVQGSPSITVLTVSVDVKAVLNMDWTDGSGAV